MSQFKIGDEVKYVQPGTHYTGLIGEVSGIRGTSHINVKLSDSSRVSWNVKNVVMHVANILPTPVQSLPKPPGTYKFKLGNKVTVIDASAIKYLETGEVIEQKASLLMGAYYLVRFPDGKNRHFDEADLVLSSSYVQTQNVGQSIEELKVGDKAEICITYPINSYHGRIGLVQKIASSGTMALLSFDDGTHGWIENHHLLKVSTIKLPEAAEFAPHHLHLDEFKASQTHPTTLYEAFVQYREDSRPKYEGQARQWKEEGRCPQCGELGRYHHGAAVCSQHGEY